jgi:uncharacterized protein YdeI (YjbR/CyaY-like superfamily)
MKVTKTLNVDNRLQWRLWLQENHNIEKEIWLVYHKKNCDVPSISYAESVEEALCFGWVEGLLKSIDAERYARRFTPRRKNSVWSKGNLERFERLKREGRVHPVALKAAPTSKTKVYLPLRERRLVMPKEFKAALAKNKKAKQFFESLTQNYKRHFIGWISAAKRAETKHKRIKVAIERLKTQKKLWV